LNESGCVPIDGINKCIVCDRKKGFSAWPGSACRAVALRRPEILVFIQFPFYFFHYAILISFRIGPEINGQASIGNHQLSIISHQPLTINRQPSIISHYLEIYNSFWFCQRPYNANSNIGIRNRKIKSVCWIGQRPFINRRTEYPNTYESALWCRKKTGPQAGRLE